MENNQLVIREETLPLSPKKVLAQVALVQQIMKEVMKEDMHFGKIPGCGEKPCLLKAGAEKLGMVFRVAPSYDVEISELGEGHREYKIICKLNHIVTGEFLGQGLGSACTRESKYRYRNAEKKCPACGKTTIIKGKEQYGGGWLCYKAKGGCGAKFADGAPEIENQLSGKVENPDIADQYNTVLKMGKKRAYVDAVISAFAVSDIFTQDLDENFDFERSFGSDKPITAQKPQNEAKTESGPIVFKFADIKPILDENKEILRLIQAIGGMKRAEIEAIWNKHEGDLFKITADLQDIADAKEAGNA